MALRNLNALRDVAAETDYGLMKLVEVHLKVAKMTYDSEIVTCLLNRYASNRTKAQVSVPLEV